MSQAYSLVSSTPSQLIYTYKERLKFRPLQAFGVALTLESLLIAAVIGWLIVHPPKPKQEVAPITIETMLEDVAPVPEKPLLPPPEKVVVPVRPKAVERPTVREPAPQAPAPAVVETPPVVATPTAFSAPPVVTPPLPLVPAGPSAEYIAKVRAAVKAVVIYPPAAKTLKLRGRVRVEFKLRDGIASQVRIITGSGIGMLDRAALQSVQDAVFPAPPAASQGKEEAYQIWIELPEV